MSKSPLSSKQIFVGSTRPSAPSPMCLRFAGLGSTVLSLSLVFFWIERQRFLVLRIAQNALMLQYAELGPAWAKNKNGSD